MKKISLKALVAASCILGSSMLSTTGYAGAVIVHPSVADEISKEDITRLFLGKSKKLPSGAKVLPIDLQDDDPEREQFARVVLNKSAKQVKAFWAKQLFTGKGTPPQEADGGAEAVKLVSENPALIGYVASGDANDSVRVVLEY